MVVAVTAYMAPFHFLYTSASEKLAASFQAETFRKELADQLRQAVQYQRKLTEYFRSQQLPLSKTWEKKYIQRKDILLGQSKVLEGFL